MRHIIVIYFFSEKTKKASPKTALFPLPGTIKKNLFDTPLMKLCLKFNGAMAGYAGLWRFFLLVARGFG